MQCLQALTGLLSKKSVKTLGRWADPPDHTNYLMLDAPDTDAIQQAMMESGLMFYTSTKIRPVLSMD